MCRHGLASRVGVVAFAAAWLMSAQARGAAPTVTAISPNTGGCSSEVVVTITGTNFTDPATVYFGDTGNPNHTARDVTVVNSTTITCKAAKHQGIPATVTVYTAGGGGSLFEGFTFTWGGAGEVRFVSSSTTLIRGVQGQTIRLEFRPEVYSVPPAEMNRVDS